MNLMLANVSTTVAAEVPVWMSAQDISAIQRQYGIELVPPGPETVITGHIDFLQVRNGAIHILDYKPDARPISRSRNSQFMRSPSRASPASNSSTLNALGLTNTNTVNSSRGP
jgi:ATP-dependent exoDNAse (exonuclease V) beta subunit